MKTTAIGTDIGGSHISCAACLMSERKYLSNTFSEKDVDNKASSDEILNGWCKTLRETIEKAGYENLKGIGFAIPGPFDYSEGIALYEGANEKYENLYGVNIAEAVREIPGLVKDFPVRFINDAAAFAIGEGWIGKAAGSKRSLSITLGTGFGSTFLENGLPVVSGDRVPEGGCVWHLPFEDGIADDYFSTRGFLKRYEAKTGVQLSGVKDLAQQAEFDPEAKALFDDFGDKLAFFLHPWMEKFSVEVLVMGGNIANAFPLFKEKMESFLRSAESRVRIEVSELKESASIIGSALLADDDYYERIKPLLKEMP